MGNDITRERVNVTLTLNPVPAPLTVPVVPLGVPVKVGESGALSGAHAGR